MQPKEPSRTAWGAARHRAVHQLIESGSIFSDPLAVKMLGGDVEAAADEALIHESDSHPSSRALRFFIVSRSAFAEAKLAEAVTERGVTQLVVLGAGFDTFAYRNPFGAQLRVFEVDHPATQAWKRERLAAMDIALPEWLAFAGVDFERESFAERLIERGFDPAQRTFVIWLGVSMYLTGEAIDATLAAVASWPGGGEIVFDYAEPPQAGMSEQGLAARKALAERVAAAGEPFIGALEPEALRRRLDELRYREIEDLSPLDLAERFLGRRSLLPPRLPARAAAAAPTCCSRAPESAGPSPAARYSPNRREGWETKSCVSSTNCMRWAGSTAASSPRSALLPPSPPLAHRPAVRRRTIRGSPKRWSSSPRPAGPWTLSSSIRPRASILP